MAIFNVFFDESGKKSDQPLTALSAVCVPAEKLAQFDFTWRHLLRHFGVEEFHMSAASQFSKQWGNVPSQTLEERIDTLKPFAECILEYLEIGYLTAWDIKGFYKMTAEAKKALGSPNDPYYIALIRIMLAIADYTHMHDFISVICDYDIETAWNCFKHYKAIRRASERLRKKTVSISFADSHYFPALQAADMAAYLARLEAKAEFYAGKSAWAPLFKFLATDRGPTHMQWQGMFANEERAGNLLSSVRARV